jgi:hypothetical protein
MIDNDDNDDDESFSCCSFGLLVAYNYYCGFGVAVYHVVENNAS